jgi:hypothetical protein
VQLEPKTLLMSTPAQEEPQSPTRSMIKMKRRRVADDSPSQEKFDQKQLIESMAQVLEDKLEQKFKDRTRMEKEMFERVRT